jgi:hypothetical protein
MAKEIPGQHRSDRPSRRQLWIAGLGASAALAIGVGVGVAQRDESAGTELVSSAGVPDDREATAGGDPTADLLVSCGSTPYPRNALESPTGAEDTDEPAAEGLRQLIVNPDGIGPIPSEGWRKVYDDGSRAVFINGAFGDDMHEVELEADGDGPFNFAGSSHGCQRASVDVPGSEVASFDLDPTTPPTPDATTIALLVNGRDCSGGQLLGDRLQEPMIVKGDDSVGLLFTADPLPPGSYTCPGNPPDEVMVELDEPLGGRAIVDLSSYPTRTATEPE